MRRTSLPAVKLDMTPMIDIVFQLLIFFILTLRIAASEGQFEVHLPRQSSGPPRPTTALPLEVRLLAGAGGELAEVSLNGRRLSGLEELHREVERLLGGDPALATVSEATLVCDPALSYEHCIAAVTAISGSQQRDGSIRPLIAKINFAAPAH